MDGMLSRGKASLVNPFKNDGDTNLSTHSLSAVATETIAQMCRTEFLRDEVRQCPLLPSVVTAAHSPHYFWLTGTVLISSE